jgi:SMC interacting uncharacterized protein involved in chromosome segregation
MEYIKQQIEARQRAWEEAKGLLDAAAAEKRDLTAEETAKYEKISADLDARAKVIESLKEDAEREVRAAESMRGLEAQAKPVEVAKSEKSDADALRVISTRRNSLIRIREARCSKGIYWFTSSNFFLQ